MTNYFLSGTLVCMANERHAIVINNWGIHEHYSHMIQLQTMNTFFAQTYPVTEVISEDEFNYAYAIAMEKIKEVANG
jgi:hypothetical protein